MRLPVACRAQADRVHADWKAARDRLCMDDTRDAEGGSMRPMLISACKTEANRARLQDVGGIGACDRVR